MSTPDDPLRFLEATANVAAIVTAAVATFAYSKFVCDRWQKRRRLEAFLRRNPQKDGRSLLELSTTLGMTETEIMDAAFRSCCIRRWATTDLLGAPSKMMLVYDPKTSN